MATMGTLTGPKDLAGLLGSFIGALPDLYAAEQDIGKISEEWAADDVAAIMVQCGAFNPPWVA